jgi:hypothetical protein
MKLNKISKALIFCFSIFPVLQSVSLSAGESVVGYVIDAQGSVAKSYSAGMPIINKTKINVSSDSKLTIFHNKKCEIIEIKGTIITFSLATYKPRILPSIKRLSVGCAAEYYPKGSNSGINLRGRKKKSQLNPIFLIQLTNPIGKTQKHAKLKLKPNLDKKSPPYNGANEVELPIDLGSLIIKWPKNKPLLKPDTEYTIYLFQNGKNHEFKDSIRTIESKNNTNSIQIIILKP